MEVIDYLNANIQHFNIDLLEYVFDVHHMADMLTAKQTSEYLQSIEENFILTPIVIKKEKVHRELKFLYFVDLTESSDDTDSRIPPCGSFVAADTETIVKPARKRKQRAKRTTETTSAKKQSKPKKSQKPKVTKKTETHSSVYVNSIKVNAKL